MAQNRFNALKKVLDREPQHTSKPSGRSADFFAVNVFDARKMRKYLSKEAYDEVMESINKGNRIAREVADQVAAGMKAWAVDRGATHYTHWFQPLNDATAEKHDSFLQVENSGETFESFSGKMLVQQEPDASSLPSGGLRNTFEARGYTAWDPASPAFVLDGTLCIPTVFISYNGEALDYKTPLLKSLHRIDEKATAVCQYFDKNVNQVNTTLGWEQEYFLVDDALYQARPDLVLTGRTLMGHSSAKDQQLEDHYFGAIPERVQAYMHDLETEAYKLGIPMKTRHNEVAPNQYELAPVFEETNRSVDHNQLAMALMKKVAKHHNFVVLMHEKPFEGINGSGKHNNWSLVTNTGVNLLAPGKNPKSNLQFLVFLVTTIKAVYENSDLLRASVASHGNEQRFGANEAPPNIISVFLGSQLSKILDQLEEEVPEEKMSPDLKTQLKLNVGKIPEILLDNTDRNRTSPFAYTGNRFEFRGVGSSINCASPMITLNTAVADELEHFKKDTDKLVDEGLKKDEAMFRVIRQYITASKNIRFEGDGYSEDWEKEAEKRGLSNIGNVPAVLKSYISNKSLELFKRNNVLTPEESEARYMIKLEMYQKNIQIESRVLGDLVINHVLPKALQYQNTIIENVKGLKELFDEGNYMDIAGGKLDTIKRIARHTSIIRNKVPEMINERKEANKIEDIEQKSAYYSEKIRPMMDEIRYHIDKLELIIDDEIWPLPKYREMLFTR